MDLSIEYKFIEEMNSSTSSNDKIELIRFSHPLVRKVLFYTYNTFQQYNITPKLLNKRPDLCNEHTNFKSVFELLDSLNNRMITGHKAITETNSYIFKNPDAKDLLHLILERNLKVRASIKLINKALPKFIPEFNVALANKYDEKTKKKVDLENDDWNASRKLDGVRFLIVVNEKGKAKLEIALAKGKKIYDKRESIKEKDQKRDMDRIRNMR